ncbi:MAG: WecB/TagA/CpsF family glycosyltransferase [Actinobacteria bacterium]|nr:WecB/TagA/CpsF family glycosyltransferase [Actinomycetota bacterium]
MESIKILNTRVDLVNVDDVHIFIKQTIKSGHRYVIGNLNINAANIAYEQSWFLDFINRCPMVFCDGKGIQLGAYLSGKSIPVQITYHTWMSQLLKFCEKNQYSLFFLGSKPGVYRGAIQKVLKKHPYLKINGYHGYFNKHGEENRAVIEKINKFQPNILIVGFGMPLQEKWIMENEDKIQTNIFLNGGAYLEWISGYQKQAPKWMTQTGFEWFYRLIREPRRLYKRYVIGNPLFIKRVIRERIKDGKRNQNLS